MMPGHAGSCAWVQEGAKLALLMQSCPQAPWLWLVSKATNHSDVATHIFMLLSVNQLLSSSLFSPDLRFLGSYCKSLEPGSSFLLALLLLDHLPLLLRQL